MDDKSEQLIKWLNDAYAMEQEISKILNGQLDDLQDLPEVRAKVEGHKNTTDQQAEKLKNLIENLGEDVSGVKSAIASLMGSLMGATTGLAPHDKMLKFALMDYATEHFEIASYKSLIAAAQSLGEQEVADVCKEILVQEEEMASWLDVQIPTLTTKILDNVEE